MTGTTTDERLSTRQRVINWIMNNGALVGLIVL